MKTSDKSILTALKKNPFLTSENGFFFCLKKLVEWIFEFTFNPLSTHSNTALPSTMTKKTHELLKKGAAKILNLFGATHDPKVYASFLYIVQTDGGPLTVTITNDNLAGSKLHSIFCRFEDVELAKKAGLIDNVSGKNNIHESTIADCLEALYDKLEYFTKAMKKSLEVA